jgi:hypothetical protein
MRRYAFISTVVAFSLLCMPLPDRADAPGRSSWPRSTGARVNALDERVAAYGSQVETRNSKVQKTNDLSQQFNVLCAHCPYSPEMVATLHPRRPRRSRGARRRSRSR